MRTPFSFSPARLVACGVSLTAVLSAGCGDTEPPKSPVRDIPGVILLDTGDDGDNTALEDDEAPAGFNSYGFWYTYDDIGSCMANDEPNPDTMSVLVPNTAALPFTTTPYSAVTGMMPPTESLENAPDNSNAIRYSGSGQEYFGAGLGYKLETGYGTTNQGVDFVAAGIAGFRFWAFSPIASSYIFKVQDYYSTPEAGQCVPRGEFPGCVGDQNCENAPNITFALAANQWTYVEAYFGNVAAEMTSGPAQVYGPLARSNWDGVDIAGNDIKNIPASPQHVYQLQFQTASAPGENGTFDLFVDNFGFIIKGGPADKSVQ